MQSDEFLALKFSNIPLLNLRVDFNETYAFVFSPEVERSIKPPIEPIRMPLLIWFGMPNDLLTLLLQRAVLGVEAYLPVALMETSAIFGKASNDLFKKLRNPFAFGSKSAVVNIYHRMPAEVHEELSLRHLDEPLFERTKLFYQNIRNPIFHGKQLHDPNIQALRAAFDNLARVYEWIDYWYNPEKLIRGGGKLASVRSKYPSLQPRGTTS